MSTIAHIPTTELREGDTLLVGASIVTVDRVEPDEYESDLGVYWLSATCRSGNFDQWEQPHRVLATDTWAALNLARDAAGVPASPEENWR